MGSWKPGARHQVRLTNGWDPKRQRHRYLAWRCVDCGQWFNRWPTDDQECPGPAAQEDGG